MLCFVIKWKKLKCFFGAFYYWFCSISNIKWKVVQVCNSIHLKQFLLDFNLGADRNDDAKCAEHISHIINLFVFGTSSHYQTYWTVVMFRSQTIWFFSTTPWYEQRELNRTWWESFCTNVHYRLHVCFYFISILCSMNCIQNKAILVTYHTSYRGQIHSSEFTDKDKGHWITLCNVYNAYHWH